MAYQPSPLVRSMALFSWNQTAYLVNEWIKSLSRGLTGCKPFLPRPESARLPAALARATPRYLRTPRFRLAEPPARPGHGKPPSRTTTNDPRIRFLDMPLAPPGPFDYPPSDTDLLPARPLVQRLRALRDVWDNPAFYITAMRLRLSRKAAPIRTGLP